MMKRMLINATQAEELRVAVVDGQKLLELEIEFSLRPEKKSNIYKGIITRIEPSLDAVFVDYGDERHGFLPFKEVSRRYFKEGLDPYRCRVSEALREGQPLIVQVEKDERGNKGAALSTFIALAGRYIVLMPASPRAAGISRRADTSSRNEMREILDQLSVPKDMGLIIRTAGIGREIEDITWDLDYLKQLWQAIVDATKRQQEPGLIYQESNLIIRAIRDYFQKDVHEILVDTQEIYDQAFGFMSYVMPHFASRIKLYRDDVPLFSRFQIEHQIETAYARQVNLPSGGSIVIDRTEALVAIDINSSRSTRGQDIEQTALTNNLEATEEIARQLRLRDLGGLIVIDFIDMDLNTNQRTIENKMREALRYDRARVQTQRLSRFGLMEISRQRLHPALGEASNVVCPRCGGEGSMRSTDSFALQALREIEDEAMKENSGEIRIQLPVEVATFLLNEKRNDIYRIELRNRVKIIIIPNKYLESPHYRITRLRHDELNEINDERQSYQWAEELKPEEERDYRQSKPVTKQQTPVVKGFHPTLPGGTIKPTKVPNAKIGFWEKVKKWFLDSDDTSKIKTEPIKKGVSKSSSPKQNGKTSAHSPRHHRNRSRYHERDERTPQHEASKETRNARGPRRDQKQNSHHESIRNTPHKDRQTQKSDSDYRKTSSPAEKHHKNEQIEPKEPRHPRAIRAKQFGLEGQRNTRKPARTKMQEHPELFAVSPSHKDEKAVEQSNAPSSVVTEPVLENSNKRPDPIIKNHIDPSNSQETSESHIEPTTHEITSADPLENNDKIRQSAPIFPHQETQEDINAKTPVLETVLPAHLQMIETTDSLIKSDTSLITEKKLGRALNTEASSSPAIALEQVETKKS